MTNLDKLTSWDRSFYDSLSADSRSICVTEQQIYLLGQALRQMEWSTRWHGDVSDMDLLELTGALENALNTVCADGEPSGACFEVDTTSTTLTYYPNDPFVDPQNSITGLIASQLKWSRFDTANYLFIPYLGELLTGFFGETFLGYFPNDVVLVPELTSLFDNPIERLGDLINVLTSPPLPSISIKSKGVGVLSIGLLNVPFGCSAVIIPNFTLSITEIISAIIEYVDFDGELPDTWLFTELNRDIVAIPPELDVINRNNFKFEDEDERETLIVFVPRINDEIPFIFPYGGIRFVEVCGGLVLINQDTGETIDDMNYGSPDNIKEGVIVSTVTDICDGVICALEQAAARFLSGEAGNTIDDIVIGNDGVIEKQEVPPVSTNLASKNGAAKGVQVGLQTIMDDIYNWLTNETLEDTKIYASAKYYLGQNYDIVIDNWDGLITTQDPPYVDTDDELTELVYCKGIIRQAVSEWVIDHATATSAQKDVMLQLIGTITDQQYLLWYSNGGLIGITDYLGYECYIREPVTFVYNGTQYNANQLIQTSAEWGTFSGKRIIQVEVTGKFVSLSDGDEHDILYRKNGTTGVIDATPENWTLQLRPSIASIMPLELPPYNASGTYKWTREVNGQTVDNINFQLNGAVNYINDADTTDQMELTITDLGTFE